MSASSDGADTEQANANHASSDGDAAGANSSNDAQNNKAAAKNEVDENSLIKGHGFQLGVTFLGVPDGILDNWFTEHGSTWDDAVNMGMTFDYFLRFKAPCEMRFTLSWFNAKTGDAYWLDKDYAERPSLADYVVNDHHFVALEVAAYHVISIIDEIAFYYGGGGWFGALLGDSKQYAVRSNCANNSSDLNSCPHEPGSVPLTELPSVFGFVVVTLGFKFTLLDMMTIRLEGGFKGYLYGELGVGIEF